MYIQIVSRCFFFFNYYKRCCDKRLHIFMSLYTGIFISGGSLPRSKSAGPQFKFSKIPTVDFPRRYKNLQPLPRWCLRELDSSHPCQLWMLHIFSIFANLMGKKYSDCCFNLYFPSYWRDWASFHDCWLFVFPLLRNVSF